MYTELWLHVGMLEVMWSVYSAMIGYPENTTLQWTVELYIYVVDIESSAMIQEWL